MSRIGGVEGYGHRLSYWSDARNDLRFATGWLPGVMIMTGAIPVLLTGIYGADAHSGCAAEHSDMKPRQIEYTFVSDDGDFDVEATINGVRVGYAWGIKDGDRLLLSDIRVNEHAPGQPSKLPMLMRWIIKRPRPVPLRGQGIGHELLTRFLREADSARIRETWGSVTEADLSNWPHLLRWYERHGFVIQHADDECVRGAVKKIVRRV